MDSSLVIEVTRSCMMAGWRQVVELAMTPHDIAELTTVSRSRTEPASRVERARMLLAYRETPSFYAAARRVGAHHQTVQRCVERALAYGPLAALDDRPRPGKEPTITPQAKAWLVSLACDKARNHGYPHELWTERLLARHAREHGPEAGHPCLANLVQGTVCKILGHEDIKPHKVRYYLERRDAEFEQKMAEVLCVYREVQVLKKAAKSQKPRQPVAIVSYDASTRLSRAIMSTNGMVRSACWLGLICSPGRFMPWSETATAAASSSNSSGILDAAYPASTAIKLILDNHSAHISKETKSWLATRPIGRFEFTFTPIHGSWLNLI